MRIKKSDGSERALAVALDEARRVPAPELDWNALEAKLERAVAAPAPAPIAKRRVTWLLALPAAASIALVAFWTVPRSTPTAAPIAASVQPADPVKNGDALPAEELLIADDTQVAVTHAGRARWTLEPNSRALVLEHGNVVRVRLIAGALKAEVVPSTEPERFVVEAGGTRVAVHGTVFRVQLRGERTLVDVEQGVVSVGPRDRPTLSTALLKAPAHGEFTLEGAALSGRKSERAAAHRVIVARPNQLPSAAPSEVPAAPDVPREPSELHPLTIGEAEAGVEAVVEAISRCFEEHTEGSHDMRVSARTELTLEVSTEGVVTDVSFEPPLSPLVQSCGEREALATRFAVSLEGAKLTRVLELSR
jgi:ferric-dicitrate binding protein FerR (iron transport regulator)